MGRTYAPRLPAAPRQRREDDPPATQVEVMISCARDIPALVPACPRRSFGQLVPDAPRQRWAWIMPGGDVA